MTTIVILGAGGNMGRRITRSLRENPSYDLRLVDPDDRGRELIRGIGLDVVEMTEALPGADIVVFAVPDRIVREVAADIIPRLDIGTSILFLDPAAVAAGRIVQREGIQCFVTHPTHPPLYSLLGEEREDARRDYWGGGLARQSLVFAIAWGDEEHALRAERLCIDMFAPITAAHRITVDQMALLEPALTETLTNGCIAVIREGLEKVVEIGVPEAAATDFLMGHLQIGIALIFEQMDWKLSEGAQLALDQSKSQLFREDWASIFEPENVMRSLRQITGGD